MSTLILSPRYTPDSAALWKAALADGWHIQRLQNWRITDEIQGSVAIYGEYLFAIAIAQQLSLALLQPSFDWLIHLPSDYLKRQIWFANLATLENYSLPKFIKPADDKFFTAKVYGNISALVEHSLLAPQTPILVAEPVVWQTEFRCFVLNRKVVTASIYSRNGELAQAENGTWPVNELELADAVSFAERLLADNSVVIPPSVVLDVGFIQDRGWAVVECNPSWASGIYGCEPRQVLHVIAQGCKRTSETE
jgi:hypothetical protein